MVAFFDVQIDLFLMHVKMKDAREWQCYLTIVCLWVPKVKILLNTTNSRRK